MNISCPACQTEVTVSFEDSLQGEIRCETCGYDLTNEIRHRVELVDDTAQAPEPERFSSIRSGTLIDQYSVLRPVGRGTFGSVYLAYDTELHRRVALKFPRLESGEPLINELFIREAQSAAQVRHSNIVPVYGIGSFRERPYIATDFIDGPSLRDWLKENSLDARTAAELCKTLAGALHEAHSKGVIHRDLKPGNILMGDRLAPYIVDFGLAKLRLQLAESPEDRGRIIGTPGYMSPEQAKGDGHRADARSDIYSLGVILYELLTGESPYRNERELIEEVCEADVRPIDEVRPDLPAGLRQLVMRSLSQSPTERPKSADEFGLHLQECLDQLPDTKAQSIATRRAMWATVMVAVLLVLTAVTYFGINGWFRSKDNNVAGSKSDESEDEEPPITAPESSKSTLHAHVISSQPGATVSLASLSDPNASLFVLEPIAKVDSTPGNVELEPGWYLAEVRFPSGDYQTFLRRIPVSTQEIGKPEYPHVEWQTDETRERWIQWPPFDNSRPETWELPKSRVEGGPFTTWRGIKETEKKLSIVLPSFFISTTEITHRQYLAVMKRLPKDSPYKLPLKDELWEVPVTHVRWDEAMRFAELVGGRLPTMEEFDYVFTNRGETDFPTGNAPLHEDAWLLGPVEDAQNDATQSDQITPAVHGMASNAFEWTFSHPRFLDENGEPQQLEESLRITLQLNVRQVRGGPESVLGNGPPKEIDNILRWRQACRDVNDSDPLIGFRVVWSIDPLLQ